MARATAASHTAIDKVKIIMIPGILEKMTELVHIIKIKYKIRISNHRIIMKT